MRLQSLLQESINDKGIFKALFIAGYPGSGKTTLIGKVHDGSLPIMTVNSDIWTEYYMKFDRRAWSDIGPAVKRNSLAQVYFHLNGLLPLYIDSTGSNPDIFKQRVEILKDMGYDLKMILIDIDLGTAKERARRREEAGGRKVEMSYIEQAYERINKDKGMYKRNIPDFKVVRNNDGEMTPSYMQKLSNEIFSFFTSPIKNPKGKKIFDFMRKNGYKYYNDIPEDVKEQNDWYELKKSTLDWY